MFGVPSHLWRLFRTGATFERTGAMRAILDALEIRGWPRFAIRAFAWPFGLFGRPGNPDLPPLPRALQAMGPAYGKCGQALSTRPPLSSQPHGTGLYYSEDPILGSNDGPSGLSNHRLHPWSLKASEAAAEGFVPQVRV